MPLVDTLVETYNKKIKKYKQTTQTQAQTVDINRAINNLGKSTDTQQTQTKK